VCESNGKYELREAQETRRDTFVMCGEKITARSARQPITENNTNGKSDCEKVIVEPKVVNQEFLKNI